MRNEIAASASVSLAVFAVYYFSTAPGLGLVDSGELTTAAVTLSIAHPTGYPLYVLLGRVWTLIAPVAPARAMVLFSAGCAAVACGALVAAALRFLSSAGLSRSVRLSSAMLIALAFAFAPSIWSSVSFAEVYPLTLLIASLLLAVVVSIESDFAANALRFRILAFYLWGLGFGAHFTILWFLPLLVWVAWRAIAVSSRKSSMMALLAVAFSLGASVTLFLPIRSSVQPLLDWSDPATFSGLLRHLTAWQYRVWMFKGDFGEFLTNFVAYLGTIPHDFGWALTILALIGAVVAVIQRRLTILILLFVWMLGVAYNLNYSIPDISTYFAVFYAPLCLVAASGLVATSELLAKIGTAKVSAIAVLLVAVVTATSTLAVSVDREDRSNDTFAQDFAMAVLGTLPDSAIVFQANWDIQSPYIYLQKVDGIRPDVVMLDLALMQRPWYIAQEEHEHPEIFADCDGEIRSFLRLVAPFQAGAPYDGRRLESAYVGMINCLIEHHYRKRPVYVRDTRNIGHLGVAAGFSSYPGGYFFRITDQPSSEPGFDTRLALRSNPERTKRVAYLLREAASAAIMQATFGIDRGDTNLVRLALKDAEALSPGDPMLLQFAVKADSFLTAARMER